MKWHIGQPIVAIVNHSQGLFNKGQEFTIKSLRGSICKCDSVEIDIGFNSSGNDIICNKCGCQATNSTGVYYFSERAFAPLDQDISELTEILTKKETA